MFFEIYNFTQRAIKTHVHIIHIDCDIRDIVIQVCVETVLLICTSAKVLYITK